MRIFHNNFAFLTEKLLVAKTVFELLLCVIFFKNEKVLLKTGLALFAVFFKNVPAV